jgi:oxygen-independent coproporphyrinogen-3 oxidase
VRALGLAREAGFENLSLDLIFGGPYQDVAGAVADANRAVELGPDHISCYGLTLENLAEDVRMAKDVRRGKLRVADDGLQEQMGLRVMEIFRAAGYERYEVSNYAKPGFESRHNTLYWKGYEWVAAGCGAHGFRMLPSGEGLRYANPRKPGPYLEAVEAGAPEVSTEVVSPLELFEERIFLGLRLAEGLDLEAAAAGTVGEVPAHVWEAADRLVGQGMLVRDGGHIAPTDRGLDFHSEVALRLMP